ncbi:MAG TPA: DedA family protein [Hyphomicrobiales bacterium]|nr:DedA family protein [Hyphomicrobiales bacterium]
MTQYIHSLIDLAAAHPTLALAVAFLVAAGEAVLFVGLFVPSTIVLLAIGGLIGLGKLPFWPIFVATTLGAIAGDQLSFWIGYIYKERVPTFSSSERYQRLLAAGQYYFARHGGKSVAIGRFIPGIKAVVPAIAGMMGMPLPRFIALNVVSACAWAAAHLLPGLSAGWTLTTFIKPEGWLEEALEIASIVIAIALIVWLARLIFIRRPVPSKFDPVESEDHKPHSDRYESTHSIFSGPGTQPHSEHDPDS